MKIGILYNLVENIERGLEIDKLSDNKVIATVNDVKRVLESKHEVIPVRVNRDLFSRLSAKSFDFVFNLCEGIDGNVQGRSWIPAILDMLGIKYTGSDSFTLGLCLDKIKTKQLLIANNILTPKYKVFYNLSDLDVMDSNVLDLSGYALKFPLIVKPSHKDASVRISDSVVHNERDLLKRVDYILNTYKQPALVEEYIDGRELSVAVVGNGNSIDVMPVSEALFDFDKDIPRKMRIKKIVLNCYNITGCRDYATVDFRLKDDEIYVLEINPNPSIGAKTAFAAAAESKGLSYNDLVYRILSEAIKRYNLNLQVLQVSEKKT